MTDLQLLPPPGTTSSTHAKPSNSTIRPNWTMNSVPKAGAKRPLASSPPRSVPSHPSTRSVAVICSLLSLFLLSDEVASLLGLQKQKQTLSDFTSYYMSNGRGSSISAADSRRQLQSIDGLTKEQRRAKRLYEKSLARAQSNKKTNEAILKKNGQQQAKNAMARELARKEKTYKNSDYQYTQRLQFYNSNRYADRALAFNAVNLSEGPTAQDNPNTSTSVPIFWHIPKAGGTTVKQIYSVCYGLVKASGYAQPQRARALEESGFQARQLEVISQPVNAKKHTNQANHNKGEQMLSYINFDLESPNERKLAKRVGLAESGMADYAITMGQVYEYLDTWTPEHPLRLFTMMRHPVDQAVSAFYYLQDATWERSYAPETKGWTIAEYVEKGRYSTDFMTRVLIDKRNERFHGELTEGDLQLAKNILREKVLIGLMTRMEESIARFDAYFHIQPRNDPETVQSCKNGLFGHGSSGTGGNGYEKSSDKDAEANGSTAAKPAKTNSHKHPKVLEGTNDWNLLAEINKWDMKLWDYAVELFQEQGRSLFSPDQMLSYAGVTSFVAP